MKTEKENIIAGFATPEATAEYARRHGNLKNAHAELGSTGLTTSRVGFGCYRIAEGVVSHQHALIQAIESGVNLIDTSTNYSDGASERLVGQVLGSLVESDELKREEVVVVTKIGYIQGENMQIAQQRAAAGNPFPEMVLYADYCYHCIHPDFLADQLARSLSRLRLETIDFLLLHNPEYYLMHAMEHEGRKDIETLRGEYYDRIRESFRYLQQQVNEGTIRGFGISSNTFPSPSDDPTSTSLARCLDLAREVAPEGGNSGFDIVQMPGNLLERELAMPESEAGSEGSVLDLAEGEDLAVLINRPLNAFYDDQLVRLADMPETPERSIDEVRASLEPLAESEREALKLLSGEGPAVQQARKLLRHSEFLESNLQNVDGLEHWKQVAAQQLIPMAQYGLGAVHATLDQQPDPALKERGERIIQRYLERLNETVRLGFEHFATGARKASERYSAAVKGALDGRADGTTLSQDAIRLLLGLPGRPVVLVGMRQDSYVNDVMGIFAQERTGIDKADFIKAGEALQQAL